MNPISSLSNLFSSVFQPVENAINAETKRITYRNLKRETESALLEKIVCLVGNKFNYSDSAKTELKEQLQPFKKLDGNRGHSIEIERLVPIAENLCSGNNKSIGQIIRELGGGDDGKDILNGKGYSELDNADNLFNSTLIRYLAEKTPGSLGGMLRLRCQEATFSVIAIALRELLKGLENAGEVPSLEEQKETVETFVSSYGQSTLAEGQPILDRIFAKDNGSGGVKLDLSSNYGDLEQAEAAIPRRSAPANNPAALV